MRHREQDCSWVNLTAGGCPCRASSATEPHRHLRAPLAHHVLPITCHPQAEMLDVSQPCWVPCYRDWLHRQLCQPVPAGFSLTPRLPAGFADCSNHGQQRTRAAAPWKSGAASREPSPAEMLTGRQLHSEEDTRSEAAGLAGYPSAELATLHAESRIPWSLCHCIS